MRLPLITLLILLFFANSGNAQKDTFVVKTEFENQGEQENYWAERFFYENYRMQNHQRYSKKIEVEGNTLIRFDNTVVYLFENPNELSDIFKLGVLYPGLFIHNETINDTLKIGSLEELTFLKLPPTKKRFRLWFYQKGFANPVVYLFELTNELGPTDLKTFIKTANLTFIKHGWIIR